MRCFTHLVAISLLQAIQNFEGTYLRFHGIHIIQNLTEYLVLLYLCVYQVWLKFDENYNFYEIFKVF